MPATLTRVHRGPSRGSTVCELPRECDTGIWGNHSREVWHEGAGEALSPADSVMTIWPSLSSLDGGRMQRAVIPLVPSLTSSPEALRKRQLKIPPFGKPGPCWQGVDVLGTKRELLRAASSQPASRLDSRKVAWPLSCSA